MLRLSIVFLVMVMDAAILAFGGLSFGFPYSTKIVFFFSLFFLVISCLFIAVACEKYLIEKEQLPHV